MEAWLLPGKIRNSKSESKFTTKAQGAQRKEEDERRSIYNALIFFVIGFLIIEALLNANQNSDSFLYELCELTIGKIGIFGIGAQDQGTCDPFRNP